MRISPFSRVLRPLGSSARRARPGGLTLAATTLSATVTVASIALAAPAATAATPAPTPLGSRVATGAWVGGMDGNPSVLNSFDQSIGRASTVASIFRGYGATFPSAGDVALTDAGQRSLLVAWYLNEGGNFSSYTSGSQNTYLDQEAATAKAYGRPVYIRPWAEMNGDWQDFQPTPSGTKVHGGTPAQFIAAWRYVVNRFRADGATNVRWVFNPTADYTALPAVNTIWPGAGYVDVLGLDGYNFGTGGGSHWMSFRDVFTTQYNRLVALDPAAPVWICEFASKEPLLNDGAPVDPSHSKAQWYTAALAGTAFPHVTTLVFFDENKERAWKLNSSAATLTAVRNGLRSTTSTAGSLATYQRLHAGQSLYSANKTHRVVVQANGNLVIYHGRRAVWQSRTANSGSRNFLVLNSVGNLVLYRADRAVLWTSRTAHRAATHLVMQNDGNLVLRTAAGRAVWSARTSGK
jgi:mannan endo-1,4-beta-mannosidase